MERIDGVTSVDGSGREAHGGIFLVKLEIIDLSGEDVDVFGDLR